MAGPTHKLFLDDSGDKDYRDDGLYSRSGGPTPLFVFAGLCAEPLEASGIEQSMRTLKHQTFGTSDVEIKANWLKRPREREKRYLKKYGITNGQLTSFTNALYEIIVDSRCQLVACVVNKKEVRDKYGLDAWHPSTIAYECLMQRAQKEMVSVGGSVSVTMDQMTGATPAGNQHYLNLRRHHNQLRKTGSSLLRGMAFDRVEGGLSFRDSADDERLQLADLVAYAIYRQFLDYGPDWHDPSNPLELYEYLAKVLQKFWNRGGVVPGYGIVKFPANKRVAWNTRSLKQ
jgi:cytidylate kinase